VPLPDAVVALLKATLPVAGTELIWPGQDMRKPMSDMSVAALVKKMHAADLAVGGEGWLDPKLGRPAVPHGFRSTFRDWAAEATTYPNEMAEIALAHDVGSAVERAYRRGDQLEKRRAMMDDWAAHALSAFCAGLRAVGQ
jgi:integrase